MKQLIIAAFVLSAALATFSSCEDKEAQRLPAAGSFVTDSGIRFELREDSTTLITFNDSLTYEGTWSAKRSKDNLQYSNIEFAGVLNYYYLLGNKLYCSEREMRHDAMGREVKFVK